MFTQILNSFKKLTKNLFNFIGLQITSREYFDLLNNMATKYELLESDFSLIQDLSVESWPRLIALMKESNSQLRQDLFVLSVLNFKQGGYYVEFGAADGVRFSNSHLLAKKFGWKGILAEPAVVWHKNLAQNRPEAIVSDLCVWNKSGVKVEFSESSTPELSTISHYKTDDFHADKREQSRTYIVETISLNDLLDKYDAPNHIDYLSIDTEGTELDILESFDFHRYAFSIITCEHNYSQKRDQIKTLLESKGYRRIFEIHSKFDDWYINESILKQLRTNSAGLTA